MLYVGNVSRFCLSFIVRTSRRLICRTLVAAEELEDIVRFLDLQSVPPAFLVAHVSTQENVRRSQSLHVPSMSAVISYVFYGGSGEWVLLKRRSRFFLHGDNRNPGCSKAPGHFVQSLRQLRAINVCFLCPSTTGGTRTALSITLRRRPPL